MWSEEQSDLPEQAIEFDNDDNSTGRIRHTLGSLPTITAIFGLTIANDIILSISEYKK